jgi:hypothetical protein
MKPIGQNYRPCLRFEFGLNSDKFEFKLELKFKFRQNLKNFKEI